MASNSNSDFPVPSNAYLSFDGLSIKDKIKQRLNQTGIFTDQNFEGSNISAFIDSLAMSFSLLLYNLNKTANEGMFTEAQLYENVNRIVKELDYKPTGHQAATLSYTMSASGLTTGSYTIPRYTYITLAGIKYSFAEDFVFTKVSDTILESIDLSSDNNLLFQGGFQEFPTYTASGTNNELLYITALDTDIIDNFNIHVYVKDSSGIWTQWNPTQSLYINTAVDKVFEVRFNENKKYEIKFGNDINGKKLKEGDLVAVYYLKTDGTKGEISANVLSTRKLVRQETIRLNEILSDVTDDTYMTTATMNNIVLDNPCKSTYYAEPETVADIKANAPSIFRNQFSLVTAKGYETFIKNNFTNIIQDVKCYNNKDYMNNYIQYFYNLGLTNPQLESRALFNQFKMADSCNFNNVYLFVVPKTIGNTLSYVTPAQKAIINETIKEEKTLTAETIIMDPVYLAVDFALSDSNTVLVSDINNTVLLVEKTTNSRRNETSIIADVNQVILDYFSRKTFKLGQTIDLSTLTASILDLDGVKGVYTKNTSSGDIVDGLRILIFNPLYGDVGSSFIAGNKKLEDYQFPYLYTTDLTSRIFVSNNYGDFEGATY